MVVGTGLYNIALFPDIEIYERQKLVTLTEVNLWLMTFDSVTFDSDLPDQISNLMKNIKHMNSNILENEDASFNRIQITIYYTQQLNT